jgi:hypothetical protein
MAFSLLRHTSTPMLIAYLDESFDQAMKEVFVAAGFIARYEGWSSVEWRWRSLLEKYELKYYRAAEAGHARGQFEKPPFRTHPNKLSREQWGLLQEVRNEFLSVLCSGRLFGLAIGMHMKDFYKVACTPEILSKFGNTPYYLCCHMALIQTLVGARDELRTREVIQSFFDQNGEHQAEMKRVHQAFGQINPEYRAQMGSLEFASKEIKILLQTADTLAYEVQKDFRRQITNPGTPRRVELERLMAAHRIYTIRLADEKFLRFYLKELQDNSCKEPTPASI